MVLFFFADLIKERSFVRTGYNPKLYMTVLISAPKPLHKHHGHVRVDLSLRRPVRRAMGPSSAVAADADAFAVHSGRARDLKRYAHIHNVSHIRYFRIEKVGLFSQP